MSNTIIEVDLKPEVAFDPELFKPAIYQQLGLKDDGSIYLRPLRRSIDARSRQVTVKFLVELVPAGSEQTFPGPSREYPDVGNAPAIIIVGAGPAGLFAALRLIELGIRPVVLERGKDVQARRRDLAAINKEHKVNPESNYCFGEGGAGTYSDGKLYTRSKKRGDLKRILETLVAHGAPAEILYDAHPHIGTNKLPKLVAALRETILRAGGQIHFNQKVAGLILQSDEIRGVVTATGDKIEGSAVILATGHSARDIFYLLHENNIRIESKPFALGVRVEHRQSVIDKLQYRGAEGRGDFLPAAAYSLVHQAKVSGTEHAVFSFCMCPGGFMVPAATSPGEIVINGMSPSRRDSDFANSGIVVAVGDTDLSGYSKYGPLAGMHFQAEVEGMACKCAGGRQLAPAQRLMDFVDRKTSATLPDSSYQPGLASVDLRAVLPGFIAESLIQGFRNFGAKMKGYLTNDAQVVGVESRTSSPVKIPRSAETLEHVQMRRLFPCGEGAGYAGGIISAAMDGERCAEAAAKKYCKNEMTLE